MYWKCNGHWICGHLQGTQLREVIHLKTIMLYADKIVSQRYLKLRVVSMSVEVGII